MNTIDKLKEEELEQLKPEDEKIVELEVLITEGVDAKLPFNFMYPNTNKRVGVLVRPLSTTEFQNAIMNSKKNQTNFLIELLKIGLYNQQGEPIPIEIIEKLPAGVTTSICNEISRISGIDLVQQSEINQDILDEFMGF